MVQFYVTVVLVKFIFHNPNNFAIGAAYTDSLMYITFESDV